MSEKFYDSISLPPYMKPKKFLVRGHDFFLRTGSFTLPQKVTPKGTVVLLQGYGEYLEKYSNTLERLKKKKFCVATFDWLGQGGSSRFPGQRDRGHHTNIENDIEDFLAFMKSVVYPNMPAPYFILAYDIGATIALAAHDALVDKIKRMVLISPFLFPKANKKTDLISRFPRLFTDLGLGDKKASITLPLENTEELKKLKEMYPSFIINEPSLQTFAHFLNVSEFLKEPSYILRYEIPTLFLLATRDNRNKCHELQQFISQLKTAKQLSIPGASGNILMNGMPYEQQAWAAFNQFIPGSVINVPKKLLKASIMPSTELNAIEQ